jgi:hypothetical protein
MAPTVASTVVLDSVFGFKVALGLPATVTTPGFAGVSKVSVGA